MKSGGGPKSLYQESIPRHADPERDRYAGDRALWLKVIIRAVFDWVSYRDSNKLLQKKIAEGAEGWLFQSSTLFNSFENICLSLGVLPEDVRRWARGLSKDQVAKIEHLDREGERPSVFDQKLLAAHGSEEEDDSEEL
jgi:hypothetical protein